MFESIIKSQFSGKPTKVLYHYTNYAGLLGIAETGTLRLSEVRHLNDSLETKELSRWIKEEIYSRKELRELAAGVLGSVTQEAKDYINLQGFSGWLLMRFGKDELAMFIGSFTEKGNLLSQWRGYCTFGKGVSLGFNPKAISTCAEKSAYMLGRCIYTANEKRAVAKKVVDEVIRYCREKPGDPWDYGEFGPTTYFDEIECNLMTIASLVKNSSFREENEWRVVVPAENLKGTEGVKYREGKHSLIPFVNFNLPKSGNSKLKLQQIYIGPTSSASLSFRALSSYAKDNIVCSKILNTHSPYRE